MGKQLKTGDKFGSYELIKSLGQGGMAEVFLAKHRGIGGFQRLVALKVIHPTHSEDLQFVESLVEEAKIAVQLNHASVGQVFDLGKIDSIYFIVMEFIDGKDLYRVLYESSQQNKQIPVAIALYVAEQVALGLAYCHDRRDHYGRAMNLVHRDVSPQNVFLSWTGDVKLLDFGIAKVSRRVRHTEAGVIKGKLQYMSPEQVQGDKVDRRSDLFSCGICLYEMLAGEMAYNEPDSIRLIEKIRDADLKPILELRPDLQPEVVDLLKKLLSSNVKERFQDGETLGRALSAIKNRAYPNFRPSELGAYLATLFDEPPFYLDDSQSDILSGSSEGLRDSAESLSSSIIFGDDKAVSARSNPRIDRSEHETVDADRDFDESGSETALLSAIEDDAQSYDSIMGTNTPSMREETKLFDSPERGLASPFVEASTPSGFSVFADGNKAALRLEDPQLTQQPNDTLDDEADKDVKNLLKHRSKLARRLVADPKQKTPVYREISDAVDKSASKAPGVVPQDNPFDASVKTAAKKHWQKQPLFERLLSVLGGKRVFGSKDKNRGIGVMVTLIVLGLLTIYLVLVVLPHTVDANKTRIVDIELESVPAGARVYVNMQDTGSTTDTIIKVQDTQLVEILLTLEGYRPAEVKFTSEQLQSARHRGGIEHRVMLQLE